MTWESVPAARRPRVLIAALISWGIALFCMERPLKLDYLWAALCIMGAV